MLPTIDIALGKLGQKKTNARLSVNDCLALAKLCLEKPGVVHNHYQEQYALAIEWLEAAHRYLMSKFKDNTDNNA